MSIERLWSPFLQAVISKPFWVERGLSTTEAHHKLIDGVDLGFAIKELLFDNTAFVIELDVVSAVDIYN